MCVCVWCVCGVCVCTHSSKGEVRKGCMCERESRKVQQVCVCVYDRDGAKYRCMSSNDAGFKLLYFHDF